MLANEEVRERKFDKELAQEEKWIRQGVEARRTRLKNLIVLGKERGYLTYAEINDHLPDDILDAEQIEGIISMINDMGIQVYDEAPDAETLLMSEAAPTAAADDVDEEAAEAAASTLDSEFGRTTDPVRMYMREMGSVELLTREGEIEIAKRIEEGLKHMILAISACPMTVTQILDLAERMIRLSGLQPGHDIEIAFTGMRQGERLNEILFTHQEPSIEIGIAGVMAAKPNEPPMQALRGWLATLEEAIAGDDRATIKAVLKDAVPEFGSAAPAEDAPLVPASKG
jgi:hypothetical protein